MAAAAAAISSLLYIARKKLSEKTSASGSDGIDGNSPAAGAIVDGTTLERANKLGLDAATHLKKFNAYPFFDALGDTIITSATGNNLRDLRILLAA
jgi:hydroxypyruvate reductase